MSHAAYETEREDDGRWLAEVPALPRVLSMARPMWKRAPKGDRAGAAADR